MTENFTRYKTKSYTVYARQVLMGDAQIVHTVTGVQVANVGDWIMMDLRGKKWVCINDTFEKIYVKDSGIEDVLSE